MRKAVAVPYIIALILGVAVIGLVGYWFATTGGKFGGQSAKTICDNKFLQYCITKSGDAKYSDFQAVISECKSVDSSYTKCSEITVGTGGGVGEVPSAPPKEAPKYKICNNDGDCGSCVCKTKGICDFKNCCVVNDGKSDTLC
ncbi:MAG: hypothetical protein HYS80_00185 [Candidatus Aenigmarchaeota archaeon]|nr:hypothetical protein [Candidatus Aenigmarchaeota archaeon]